MSVVQFSTRDAPEELRKDLVENTYNGHVRTSVDFLGETPVAIDMRMRSVGSVHIAFARTTPVTLVTPSDDENLVYLSFADGNGVHDADGEALFVRPGDVNVMRRDRRTVTTVAEESGCLSIAIPRMQIVSRLTSTDNLLRTLTLSDPVAHLLNSYAMSLLRSDEDISADDQAVFSSHLIDLAVLMLGAKPDSAQQAGRNGARAARRQAIMADIEAHLSEPGLSLDWLARRHGISVPYIRSLFYDQGISFTGHVMAARLDYVHKLLVDPLLRDRNIATLALMAGFGDISWFNQAFRRRFHATPSDVRESLGRRQAPQYRLAGGKFSIPKPE